VLWNPDNPGNALALKEVETAAQAPRAQLARVRRQRPDKLMGAFEAVVGAQCNGILAIEDSVLFQPFSPGLSSLRLGAVCPPCMPFGNSPMRAG